MNSLRYILILLVFLTITSYSCESLKSSKPIMPIREYERMIAGRLDADYVGTENCLSACHFHDDKKQNLDASTMGIQLYEKTGMPLVDCETCHGPGSLAIEGITREKVEKDAQEGKQTACNYETLISIKNLPAQAKSLICLKCHTATADFNLHNWNAGAHNISDVACSDCHDIHAGPDLRVEPNETTELCQKCHPETRVEFSLPSRHPVPEKRVFCTNCHESHGTINDNLLRRSTIKDTCSYCHSEKAGPFLFEHAENTEDCTSCHSPHGSVNNNLLTISEPFLCMQCHAGHRTSTTSTTKQEFYTRCTDCHSQIHGTDIPGATGTGRFTQ